MPQSLSKVFVHLVFSTKFREPLIMPEIRNELYSYISGILFALQSPPIAIGGVSDHMHILFILSKNRALCDVVEEIKKRSSKWIKTKNQSLSKFQWQRGYGAFSVSRSAVSIVEKYIKNQSKHHQKMIYMKEYRYFLIKNNIPYDERYVWD